MPEPNPATDSANVAADPQGTAAPSNDQSGATGEGAESTTPGGFDETFLSGLRDLDPEKHAATLPKEFNDRFIDKRVFTQKTQALSDERRQFDAEKAAIFEMARKVIAGPQVPGQDGPTAAEKKYNELRDLAAAGDPEALQAIVDMRVAAVVNPMQGQASLQQAAQWAQAANPVVREEWGEIVKTIDSDPVLTAMTKDGEGRYSTENAKRVFLALGIERQNNARGAALTARDAEITQLKAKLSTYEKERVSGLPATTTKAGTTAGRPAAGEDFKSVMEAAKAAYVMSGGRSEDFR